MKSDSFRLAIFFPDGAAAEVSEYPAASLSERWLAVCEDILARGGPVVTHNMGSTLSHFDLRMAGPIGELLAYGRCQFNVALSTGRKTEQDLASLDHFARLYRENCRAAGVTVSDDSLRQIHELGADPSILLFDHVDATVAEEQKAALAQLGLHFAAAYLRYLKAKDANSSYPSVADCEPRISPREMNEQLREGYVSKEAFR